MKIRILVEQTKTTFKPPILRERSLGITILTAVQVLVGLIHVIFGLWLVSASVILNSGIVNFEPVVYSIYTVFYGFFSLLFAKGIWEKKKWGWIGTVSLAIVVIVPDALAIFDLPTIPGIPKSAAWLEIVYSLIVIIYLTQEKIRKEYRVFK